jgi:RNA polymerase sigma-70 factor (ECF subfamily)
MRSLFKEKFLLYRIRVKNDAEAFGQVYDTFVKQIHRFIFFKVSSPEVAEDLTSESFLKAWQYLKEKREVTNLQAFLYSVARSAVIDHYRRQAHQATAVPLDDEVINTIPDASAKKLADDLDVKAEMPRVLEKLRGLKDEYREIVVMRYLDDLDNREIAEVLGKTAANVRVILHRATRALAEAISNDLQGRPDNVAALQE